MAGDGARLKGRKAQAALNDEAILAAAREVFLPDPAAPIAAVAERAGVGIGALYHRYDSKEELLRTLCANGQQVYVAEIEKALASDGEPWAVFTDYLRRIVAANTHGLTVRLAGLFTPQRRAAGSRRAHVGAQHRAVRARPCHWRTARRCHLPRHRVS